MLRRQLTALLLTALTVLTTATAATADERIVCHTPPPSLGDTICIYRPS